jgi:hypothetical protein
MKAFLTQPKRVRKRNRTSRSQWIFWLNYSQWLAQPRRLESRIRGRRSRVPEPVSGSGRTHASFCLDVGRQRNAMGAGHEGMKEKEHGVRGAGISVPLVIPSFPMVPNQSMISRSLAATDRAVDEVDRVCACHRFLLINRISSNAHQNLNRGVRLQPLSIQINEGIEL